MRPVTRPAESRCAFPMRTKIRPAMEWASSPWASSRRVQRKITGGVGHRGSNCASRISKSGRLTSIQCRADWRTRSLCAGSVLTVTQATVARVPGILPGDFRRRQPELTFQFGNQRQDPAAFFLERPAAGYPQFEDAGGDVHGWILSPLCRRVKPPVGRSDSLCGEGTFGIMAGAYPARFAFGEIADPGAGEGRRRNQWARWKAGSPLRIRKSSFWEAARRDWRRPFMRRAPTASRWCWPARIRAARSR